MPAIVIDTSNRGGISISLNKGGSANSGDHGKSEAGSKGTAVSGNYGTSKSGNYGTSISRDYGTSSTMLGGKAQAGHGGQLRIDYLNSDARQQTAIGEIGENGLEANILYKVHSSGSNAGTFYKA